MRFVVRGLSPEAEDADARLPFERAGFEVERVVLVRDRVTNGCRGFAFVDVRLGGAGAREIFERLHLGRLSVEESTSH